MGGRVSIEELAAGPPLDLAVIGGGINGCAIAEEAAARGLRVALFEATDFGFGTTWRSTKLIHGGLRYLEHGDVRLVFESLRERAWLLKTRPYMVTPQRFLLPMLPWTRRPRWQLRAGLATYDMLALYRGVPSHRHLGKARLREVAPYLPETANGGFSFFDARVHSPERLTLELALSAERMGAQVFNHTPVARIVLSGDAVAGVEVESGGRRIEVRARAVVNAGGPWVDAVNRLEDVAPPEVLGVTRGTHIVVELDGPPGHNAVFSTAKSDGRVFFAVPQGDLLLIGTTDERYDGDPSEIRPVSEDIEYLVAEARELLPGRDITRARIRYAYAGLRPLQKVAGGPEAAISRRHAVLDHARMGGARGMYSVVGGKLSTFRPLAEEVVERLDPPGRRMEHTTEPPAGWREALIESGLPRRTLRHLRVFGGAIPGVLALGTEAVCEHSGAIAGEVRHAARSEHVTTLGDIMLRRTGIAWASCRGLCCHEQVARIAAEETGWSPEDVAEQVRAFEGEVAYHLPTENSLAADPISPR